MEFHASWCHAILMWLWQVPIWYLRMLSSNSCLSKWNWCLETIIKVFVMSSFVFFSSIVRIDCRHLHVAGIDRVQLLVMYMFKMHQGICYQDSKRAWPEFKITCFNTALYRMVQNLCRIWQLVLYSLWDMSTPLNYLLSLPISRNLDLMWTWGSLFL